MVPKIIIESQPDPNYRRYYINTEISQSPRLDFWRPLRESSEFFLKQAGEIGSTLIRKVFNIPGVIYVFIKPYELAVTKGEAFDWEEVETPVLEVLKETFGEVEVVVTEEREAPPSLEEETKEAIP